MLYKFILIPAANKRCEKATGDFLFYVIFLEKNVGSFLFFIWFVETNACDLKWNKWLSCLSSDVLQKDYIDHFCWKCSDLKKDMIFNQPSYSQKIS